MMSGSAPDSPATRIDANTPDSPWAGVVSIRVGNNTYSGVAVSAHHILTACHVAGAAAGNLSAISIQLNAGSPRPLAVAHIETFPTCSFPYDDLALLTIDGSLPASVPTYPINDLPPIPGQTHLTLVGYGDSGTGDKGVTVGANPSVKRVGENILDTLVSRVDTGEHASSFYFYDFDGPDGNGPLGEGGLGNMRETMVSSGDSGSPAFTLIKGYQTVTGINNFASPLNSGRALNFTFGQGGGGMLLSDPRFVQWLLDKSDHEIRLASTLSERQFFSLHWPWLVGGIAACGLVGTILWNKLRT